MRMTTRKVGKNADLDVDGGGRGAWENAQGLGPSEWAGAGPQWERCCTPCRRKVDGKDE